MVHQTRILVEYCALCSTDVPMEGIREGEEIKALISAVLSEYARSSRFLFAQTLFCPVNLLRKRLRFG